jgi:DNA-binding NtrC family response regulator
MMPEMDGITLIKAALEIDPRLVVLIMTGQGTIQSSADAENVGVFDYVLKPFRLLTLIPILIRAIGTRRWREESAPTLDGEPDPLVDHRLGETALILRLASGCD